MTGNDLKGKVALVTGGAGYLAGDLADALASAEATVVLADVDGDRCVAQADELAARGLDVTGVGLDVTSEESVSATVQRVIDQRGRIDVLVSTAGRTFFKQALELSLEEWNTTWQTNVTGTFLCARTVGAHMLERGAGSIINFGSIYGIVAADQSIYGDSGRNSSPAYAASKAAIIHLTRYLAKQWAPGGVRVNCVSPGGVYAEQQEEFVRRYVAKTPAGRMAERSDMRGVILFLASDASSYVTGQNIAVDGGFTL